VRQDQPTATIAILGSDTVVGRALCVLLEGSGYQITLLDSYPTGVVDELLEDANLLLLIPRVDEGVREAFLGAMDKSTLQAGTG
jgi:nucleoside-diphosphate-sugar epimerase